MTAPAAVVAAAVRVRRAAPLTQSRAMETAAPVVVLAAVGLTAAQAVAEAVATVIVTEVSASRIVLHYFCVVRFFFNEWYLAVNKNMCFICICLITFTENKERKEQKQ